jgi:hypothetical protein
MARPWFLTPYPLVPGRVCLSACLQVMISGVTGEPFPVDIYVGLVYYQRLRHMVLDKFQVGPRGGCTVPYCTALPPGCVGFVWE